MEATIVESDLDWLILRGGLFYGPGAGFDWRDILTYVCAIAGSAPPQPGGRAGMPSFRVINRRARELLAWAPVYSDYRVGLVR
jgi:hypothetical protein